jgi:hypothetical protein
MTTAKKPAAPRAAAAKTTTRTVAAKPAPRAAAKPVAKKPVARAAAKPAPRAAAKPAAKKPVARASAKPAAKAVAAAPTYEFTKPYKFLTGFDDSDFCGKVSAHLNAGYKLAGSATMTTVGGKVYVGQPVFKASNIAKPKAKPKAKGKKK